MDQSVERKIWGNQCSRQTLGVTNIRITGGLGGTGPQDQKRRGHPRVEVYKGVSPKANWTWEGMKILEAKAEGGETLGAAGNEQRRNSLWRRH